MRFSLALGEYTEHAAVSCGHVDMPDEGNTERRMSLETEGHDGHDNKEHGGRCHHL